MRADRQLMTGYALVFVGGGIGAAARHAVYRAFAGSLGFPAGTLLVNVLGSLLMGLLAAWLLRRGAGGEPWGLLLGTGVLGGFTTFSAFSLDTVALWQRGEAALAMGYAAGSVALSLAALIAGLALGRLLG